MSILVEESCTGYLALQFVNMTDKQGAYLFALEKTSNALTERVLGYLVKRYASTAKLAFVSPHDLGNRFVYRMAESVPLDRLAQIVGHDLLDTTMIYVQGTKSDLQKVVEKIAWELEDLQNEEQFSLG